MADELLNGREATDCELDRDKRVVAGLIAEYPREPDPVPRPVTDVPLGLLP